MHFTSDEVSTLIGAYLWPFCRIGAFVMAVPLFGSTVVPARVRLVLALALTVVIAPVIPSTPVPILSLQGGGLIVQQFLIGIAMALVLQMVFQAFVIGGQTVAMQMGLGFASMIDPQHGVSVSVVSQLYQILITLVFLALDGHLVVIQVLAESFYRLPLGMGSLSSDNFWQLVGGGSWMFAGSMLIALPAIGALLLVNLTFGVMTRAAPQLNPFSIGFPLTLILGFGILLFTLPSASSHLVNLVDTALDLIRTLLREEG
ncbi:flagellar biosynthetic protein FliR [Nitrosococcus wardiae]|uniref:Flagellar biosynthetic protein FliR n=1 Tax=Nitrosococcus wardiae TaxID=1814290 RepID=A0A4P7BYK7_9GAMM|nr:flagellar biosynthetic protein FliR [Nitrosococcus wardiae]QBQ53506.1 flagellar biosynthetic protein FliR [Nitrosococcus wardiae]